MTRLAQITIALALSATTANAQIVPHSEVGEYNIAHVISGALCYAVLQQKSVGGEPMIYTYYETKIGQRWHVLGYADPQKITDASVNITIDIDDTETLKRETPTSDGDFMFPFANLDEIQAHEALIETGAVKSIAIAETGDTFEIQLEQHRAALSGLQDCLATIEE